MPITDVAVNDRRLKLRKLKLLRWTSEIMLRRLPLSLVSGESAQAKNLRFRQIPTSFDLAGWNDGENGIQLFAAQVAGDIRPDT